jgi:hypothetical protein
MIQTVVLITSTICNLCIYLMNKAEICFLSITVLSIEYSDAEGVKPIINFFNIFY